MELCADNFTMLPYINIFSRTVPMYGVMTAAGALCALLYLALTNRKFPELAKDNELFALCAALGAFFGAKLLYLLVELPELMGDIRYITEQPAAFAEKYLFSGFVFYGGLYGGLYAVFVYSRAARLPLSRTLGYLLPVFPLIHAFGRIGCFLMGCCYGKPWTAGMAFYNSPIAPNGVPLVPVQLIEAAGEFLLFCALAYLSRRTSGRKMLTFYILAYSVMRFILEFWRGDIQRGFIGVLSVSQVIAVLSVLMCTGYIAMKKLSARRESGK